MEENNTKVTRDKAMFYRSYWEAAQIAGLKGDEFQTFFESIFRAIFDGEELKDTGDRVVDTALVFIRKLVMANRYNYVNARKGGAPKGNKNSRRKTTDKTNKKPGVNKNTTDGSEMSTGGSNNSTDGCKNSTVSKQNTTDLNDACEYIQPTVNGKQLTVNSKQITVNSKQQTVNSKEKINKKENGNLKEKENPEDALLEEDGWVTP